MLDRDFIVIGASAGGVRALPIIVVGLPKQLPASVVIIQHVHATSTLPEILGKQSALPVAWAEDGAPIEHGHVYVARPQLHTTFEGRHLRLSPGAREHGARPSINRAFRSAAAEYRSRSIAIVLTGMLDDGATGLAEVRAVGGLAVVQNPSDAEFPEMPRNALTRVGADFVVTLREIAPTLLQLVKGRAP